MNWLLIAIIAQIILGVAGVFDSLLLRKRVQDPIVYAFWLGILGIFALILMPFGFIILSPSLIGIALVSGATFVCSLFLLFIALTKTEASLALPLTAALIPLCTFVISLAFIGKGPLGMDIIGIALLILGAYIFSLAEKKELRSSLLLLLFASSFLYGFSVVLQKIVFDQSSFVTGFVWTKIGGILFGCVLLAFGAWRKRIINGSRQTSISNRAWYTANRIGAASGSVLLGIAISLAHPALVESTQGLRYVVIFIASWLILRERFRAKTLFIKIIATFFIVIGLLWLGLIDYARHIPYDLNRAITWGITFSNKYSHALGLDWKENFNAIATELHPKKMRLIAYWDEIEKEHGVYDFSHLDWELDRAREAGIQVALVVGMKTPRWPECHMPLWAQLLDPENREHMLREYIPHVIGRYQHHPEIFAWQIENEPFLKFGLCAKRGADFFEKEMALVRSLDPLHPIIVTDGGEFGTWNKAIRAGDIFGTTMYRRVYPPSIGRYVGIVDYPLDPSFFRFRQKLARFLTNEKIKPFVVIELQAEPWGAVEAPLLPYEEQTRIFSPRYFRETIEYAKETDFNEYYLWGAEWWYYTKEKHSDPRYWKQAKNIIQNK